ncbi:Oidioi.mRNA.OKI2018_I69.PAR.g11265.t2.cds [Oikopleura dioica]|uniref:Oidioi.mRNA.OKI2018_I69.PAR.g11265.t2.cds n=1 Tax=Oikopleura dioica TaxID=34765 RepID=A0ABN7RVN3_OIKDI|nr:Oidioi.mRNA.OKI2018_I69.PAR.g11265.t2.cds [Oikopleura dioica]
MLIFRMWWTSWLLLSSSQVIGSKISGKQCNAHKNIFFLKTHKAGSTTLQNVLLRYGEANSLTFALPKQPGAHVFNYNLKFNSDLVRPSPSGSYNILCNHLHFDEKGVKETMPKDTKYIAIVRNPLDLFESIMSYYTEEVRAFQRVPGRDIQNNDETDERTIKRWIERLDQIFDLVLITDFFDESMILLKEELCWTTEDITFIKSNSRKLEKSKSSTADWLSDEYQQKLIDWNKADWMLYQHFNTTFANKVENFGRERMDNEIKLLNEANQKIADDCLREETTTSYFHSVPIQRYKLKDKNDNFCSNYVRSERQYLNKINQRQEEMLNLLRTQTSNKL